MMNEIMRKRSKPTTPFHLHSNEPTQQLLSLAIEIAATPTKSTAVDSGDRGDTWFLGWRYQVRDRPSLPILRSIVLKRATMNAHYFLAF